MHGVLMAALAETNSASALAAVGAIWNSAWPYLLMLAGFSLIVFVHELGHFAVAKWAGVRVEKFAIGFGREIFGFTRGETRYSFNFLPLGGYVKMLGQEDFDDKTNELRFNDDPRSFANKPVGHRMAVVSAGVIMNALFACFVFMIVFMIGMQAPAPRIGTVEPDSPADKAGLLPGDVIHSINGERVLEFGEIQAATLLSKLHEPLEVVVERDGEIVPPLFIIPEYRDPSDMTDIKRQVIGISPGVTREILAVGPEIDSTRPDRPRPGDVLVEVGGIAITDQNVSEVINSLAYANGDLWVERKNPKSPDAPPKRVQINIPPRLIFHPEISHDPRTVSLLGMAPLAKIASVNEKRRGFFAGLKAGDTVVMWDDRPHPTIADVYLSVIDSAERDIPFRVRRLDGTAFGGFVRPAVNKRGSATIHAVWMPVEDAGREASKIARFDAVRPGGIAARAGIEHGDEIIEVNGLKHPNFTEINRAVRRSTGTAVTFSLRKPDGRTATATVVPEAPGTIGVEFGLVANEVPMISQVIPTVDGRPSPAATAGIPAGVGLRSVDGQAVSTWRDIIERFQSAAGREVEIGFVSMDGKEGSARLPVPQTVHTMLGIGPEGRIISIDGRDTVKVDGVAGEQVLTVRHRAGMRAILDELVGRADVVVEFRANPLSPKQSATIAVTEDMVDPWVARIGFERGILPGPEMVLLQGKNFIDAVGIGIHKTYYFILQVYTFLERMIFTRSLGAETMSGPLGIFDLGGQVARADLVRFLFFMAMLSANLAVINFLPLPIMDGGLMVFLIIEKIKGSPVSLRVQVATQMIGLFLIVGFFLFVTYQDALRMLG